MRVIRDTAAEAGFPPEDYIPKVIQTEYELVEGCARIVASAASDTVARIAGVEVRDEHASVFHAALLLKRAALERRLRAIRAAPLAPTEAQNPLEERIARIDSEVRAVWHTFPVSEVLELITARVALRDGGIGWQSLGRPGRLSAGGASATRISSSSRGTSSHRWTGVPHGGYSMWCSWCPRPCSGSSTTSRRTQGRSEVDAASGQ
jgi:hypothetical protein